MNKLPRIDRKSLKTPDEFVRGGQKIFAFLVGQRNRFVPVLIIGLVVVAGVYGYDWFSGRNLEKAWLSVNGAMKLEDKEKWEKLKSIYSEIASTRAGQFAAVQIADHYFDESKKALIKEPLKVPESVAVASEWYGKALTFKGLLPMETQLLRVNRGQALELEKKYDDALKEFESLLSVQGDGKPLAMLSMGRIQELKGDKAKAIETYEKVSQDFSNTEYGKVAKNHLRRLKGNLFGHRGS